MTSHPSTSPWLQNTAAGLNALVLVGYLPSLIVLVYSLNEKAAGPDFAGDWLFRIPFVALAGVVLAFLGRRWPIALWVSLLCAVAGLVWYVSLGIVFASLF